MLDPTLVYFDQVKEKFGMLRVYMSWETQAIEDAIVRAEDESERTCEMCGGCGEHVYEDVGGGSTWELVRCEECLKQWREERAKLET